jgi:small-conductance mechanosensitive channel
MDVLEALNSASGVTIGLSVAAGLMLAIVVLLPANERKLLRQPIFFLIVHFVFKGIELVTSTGSTVNRVASIVGLTALLICIGRSGVLLVIDILLGRRFGRPLPKIIHDIVQAVVYFVLLLGVLRQVGLEPGQLLTTSALLTAVIGLSLQDTLGNLFAGLSVQMQRPFDVGDWIQFDSDNKNIGRVVEINWRATKLITLDDLELIVPNGLLAKAPLRNYTKPTATVRRSLFVMAPYDVPPRRVQQIILASLEDVPGMVMDPPPSVVTNAFLDSGIEYWIRIFTNQFHRRDGVDGAVRDRVWYAFQRAGISFPFPQRVVHMLQHSEESKAREAEKKTTKRDRALERVDFLRVISDEQRRDLAERATIRLFSAGETIVRQGEETTELFIVLRGEVVVVLEGDFDDTELTRLGPGQFFGEMALVTGERRKATVRAERECELLVIDHDAFEAILHQAPGIIEELSKVLAERQLQLDERVAALSAEDRTTVVQQQSFQLLGKIKKLFSI